MQLPPAHGQPLARRGIFAFSTVEFLYAVSKRFLLEGNLLSYPLHKGWRLTCAHKIRLSCAHRLFCIFNSPAHTGFASAAHTSITFFFKHPMLPQTQLRTQDSPHLRTHKLSLDLFLLIASCWVGMGGWGVGGC